MTTSGARYISLARFGKIKPMIKPVAEMRNAPVGPACSDLAAYQRHLSLMRQ